MSTSFKGGLPEVPASWPPNLTVEEALAAGFSDGTLARGSVNLISLAPIVERLGERWERKRDDVWRHVETLLRRQFGADDVILRIDDETVLIAQPTREPLAAQARCVRATADLMRFFVGDSPASKVRLKVVESIRDETIVASALEPDRLQTMLLANDPAIGRPVRVRSTPVLTRLGRSLTLTLSLQPLWSLRGSPRRIGHYAGVALADGDGGAAIAGRDRMQLQPGELADIDITVLSTAMAMRASSPRLSGGLIIPISYLTLANSSTRYQILHDVRQLAPADRKSFGWELVDLESGIPSGRLSELVGFARSHCRGVICRLPLAPANAEKAHQAGATMSLDPPEAPYTELDLFRLEGRAGVALKSIRALLVHAVPPEHLPIAAFAGATHCTALRDAAAGEQPAISVRKRISRSFLAEPRDEARSAPEPLYLSDEEEREEARIDHLP